MELFAIKDIVSKKYISVTMAQNSETFIRTSLFPILMDFPIKDVELYKIGNIDEDTGFCIPCIPHLISWESYKFPVDRAIKDKFLSIAEIEKEAQKKKKQLKDEQLDSIENLDEYKDYINNELEKTDDPQKTKVLKEELSLVLEKIKNKKRA